MKLYIENARKVVTKHPSCVEVGECRPGRQANRKDTRHWCRGRVGIPHTWEWRRQRSDIEREQRMQMTYNRISEHPVCFACEKVDYHRRRQYCGACGEPWPELQFDRRRWRDYAPCVRCGAPWLVRHRESGSWAPAGSVVR